MTRILVVERDESSRRCLRDGLVRSGFDVVEALAFDDIPQGAIEPIEAAVVNAALLAETGDLIALAAPAPVVLVADSPSIAHAVDCMRLGAADYLPRPFESTVLVAAVERARACPAIDRIAEFSPLLGESPPMRELFDRIAKTAPTDSPVLIHGESGTGKEVVARALHAASRRRYAQMIVLHCTAVPDALLAQELFGREPGAPSLWDAGVPHQGLLEVADGGTLFLDEIDRLPPAAQARLLRFLQDDGIVRRSGAEARRLDVRLLASTRHDLETLAGHGYFHKDLLQRLSTTLRIPPLRDRIEDLAAIARTVLERTATCLDKRGLSFSAAALDAMRRYPWPGNVRELSNAVERAAMLCRSTIVAADLLTLDAAPAAPSDAAPSSDLAPPSGGERATSGSLEDFFVHFVLENQDQHTETELASKLGISRKSLWERRQRLNIPRRRTRKRGARRDQG